MLLKVIIFLPSSLGMLGKTLSKVPRKRSGAHQLPQWKLQDGRTPIGNTSIQGILLKVETKHQKYVSIHTHIYIYTYVYIYIWMSCIPTSLCFNMSTRAFRKYRNYETKPLWIHINAMNHTPSSKKGGMHQRNSHLHSVIVDQHFGTGRWSFDLASGHCAKLIFLVGLLQLKKGGVYDLYECLSSDLSDCCHPQVDPPATCQKSCSRTGGPQRVASSPSPANTTSVMFQDLVERHSLHLSQKKPS